jgi:chromosome segregation ATPase
MEGMFVWIVLFAGGALLFLGVLLIASERELKNKRREVEALLSKLEGFSEGMSSTGGASLDNNASAEVTELRAHNRELENQVARFAGDLERSQRAIQDMQATQEMSGNNSTEIQELRTANERLQMDITQLRRQLASNEANFHPSGATHETSPMKSETEAELKAVNEKLYESAARIRHLEDIELRHREERQNLEAHITELEEKLSATEQCVSELDHLRARSERAERDQQELRKQIQQREQELLQSQARIAEAEEHRQRLAALQTPYHALLSKQSELADKQRELQADLEAFAKLMNHADSR